MGSTRVTVTAAAFEQRGTLGSRRTKKTRTKTCYKKNKRIEGQSNEEIQRKQFITCTQLKKAKHYSGCRVLWIWTR